MKRRNLLLLATKLTEKIPDSRYAKNTINHLQPKIITQPPKTFGKPNIVDIKSVIIERPKTSHKLSKIIRKAEKVSQVGSNTSLYSDTKRR